MEPKQPKIPNSLFPQMLANITAKLRKPPQMAALQRPEATGMRGSFEVKSTDVEDEDILGIDIEPNQWSVDPKEQPEEAKKVTGYVRHQFDEAYRARQEMEIEWAQALAFFEGRQWFRINSQTRNLVTLQSDRDPPHRYMTVNKIRPLIDGVVGKLTQVAPDCRAVPLSYNPKDQQAADEANFIAGHYTRKFSRETQTKERVRWACITGTSFVKVSWNAKSPVVIPMRDLDSGEITGYKELPLGDVDEEIVPCFNVFLDPKAQRDEDVRYIIHASIKPLSWFVDNYGDAGKLVEPDAVTGQNAGYVDAYLEGANASGTGWVQPSTARLNNVDIKKASAIVYEYWEKPTAVYPNGRYIVSTNTALLYAGDWPYNKKDKFPFIPLRWQPRSGTPYGHSLAFDLCPLQLGYNRVYSRMIEQFEQNKDYIMVERGANIGADAFQQSSDDIDDKARIYRKVYYNRGSQPPVIQRAPGISNEIFPMLQSFEKDMMDIAGLHDVSQGQAQAGTPAEAVKLLQRADNTQHSYIRADIERSVATIKEWEIALVEQFAVAPFIGSVDDNVNPRNEIQQGIITYDSIRSGGQYRVVYIPGSSQRESDDQKLQKVVMLRQMGLFGDPNDPETNAMVVRMLQLPETSDILQNLAFQAQKQQAMQEQMMQMQQAQMAAQQKFNPEAEQMKAQLQMQQDQAKAQLDVQKMQEQAKIDTNNYAAKAITDVSKDLISGKGAGEAQQQGTRVPKQKS